MKERFCIVSPGACFSTNAERSMIDLECWQWSALLNFTNCGWQSTCTGRLRWWSAHLPTSSVHCSWPSGSDGYCDRPPAFQRLERAATRTTAVYPAESKKIALYSSLSLDWIDYKSLTAEYTLCFADYRCQISSSTLLRSLCSVTITIGYITYITSFGVDIGYKVYNTSDITWLPW